MAESDLQKEEGLLWSWTPNAIKRLVIDPADEEIRSITQTIQQEKDKAKIKLALIESVLKKLLEESSEENVDVEELSTKVEELRRAAAALVEDHLSQVSSIEASVLDKTSNPTERALKLGDIRVASSQAIQSLDKQLERARQLEKEFAVTPEGKLARKVKGQAKKIGEQNGLSIFKLPVQKTYESQVSKYRHYEVGGKPRTGQNKVLMMTGMTGAGKSLMTNNIINYVYGVSLKDSFRLKLVCEEEELKERPPNGTGDTGGLAESMTTWISCYTLYHQEGFRIPYTLTIIDTPGFGDTRGIKHDQAVVHSIRQFFEDKQYPVDEMSNIGLVVQASQARLTAEQLYVFNAVLDIFGKDIEKNISLLFTFADAQPPPALQVIKAEKIPHNSKGLFKFNNSAVYAGRGDKSIDYFWEFGYESLRGFFQHVGLLPPTSLKLTKEVLKERDQLHQFLDILRRKVDEGMDTLKRTEVLTMEIMKIKGTMEANKNYKVKTTQYPQETKVVYHNITNCKPCMRTCHDPCGISGDNKEGCASMAKGKCVSCPGKCPWASHSNGDRIYIYNAVEVETTVEEMLQNFQIASSDKDAQMKLLNALMEEYIVYKEMVFENIQKACQAAHRLEEIGLGKSVLNSVGYIERLIESEEKGNRPNKKDRLAQLHHFREKAALLQKTMEDPGAIHCLSAYEKTVYEAIDKLKEESTRRYQEELKKQRREKEKSWIYRTYYGLRGRGSSEQSAENRQPTNKNDDDDGLCYVAY